jgi:hypothetical protein
MTFRLHREPGCDEGAEVPAAPARNVPLPRIRLRAKPLDALVSDTEYFDVDDEKAKRRWSRHFRARPRSVSDVGAQTSGTLCTDARRSRDGVDAVHCRWLFAFSRGRSEHRKASL